MSTGAPGAGRHNVWCWAPRPARAAIDGQPMADLEDVKQVAPSVLRHRPVTNFAAEADGRSSEDVVEQLIAEGSWLE